MEHAPAATPFKVDPFVPLVLQIDAGEAVNVTANPDVAVALRGAGVPTVKLLGAVNEIL